MKLKHIYLAATILGIVLPYYQFYYFAAEAGISLSEFIDQIFANPASSMCFVDLLICCVVFWIFVYREGRRLNISNRWVYVVVNIVIGLSFAFPLFLYFREQKLEAQQAAEVTD